MEVKEVKITRTIANTYIMGKTSESNGYITIERPYELIMGMEGIQMIPMDSHVLGTELDKTEIKKEDTLYSQEPSGSVKQTYLEALTGIETPKQEIIV